MQAWEQFLQSQEAELGTETVQKWLRTLKVQRFDACNLYLEAKDSFQALWFEEHVRGKAQVKLVNGNNKRIKIHLSVANTPPASSKTKEKEKKKTERTQPPFELIFDELNPHCLFEHFIVTEENKLTVQFLKEIADLSPYKTPGAAHIGHFNPIFLYGSGGSGKTHLLMSLVHCFQSQGLKTIYMRAERFTDHVVSAIRAGEMSVFRQAYRNIDILVIDDVHVFSRKDATQEEFFHTFNTLHLAGKQIILSANCMPQELQLIEPRLVSRFEWGLVLPIHCLQTEEMMHLLRVKAKALNFPIPQRIEEFLVETFKSNSKALIKAFEALVLRLHLDPRNPISSLSVAAAKTLLSDLIVEEEKSALNPAKIIQTVAEQYGIRSEDILGKAQSRDCALPRQLSMHLCRHQLKMPFMKIGDLFSRDHSTVMSSVKQIQKSLDEDNRELAGVYQALVKKLQN